MTETTVDFIGDASTILAPALKPFGYVPGPNRAPNSVAFESREMKVAVTWAFDRGGDVFIEICERRANRQPLQLLDVDEEFEVPATEARDTIASMDYPAILEFIRRSMTVLTERCVRVLFGDQETLDRLRYRANKRAETYTQDLLDRQERRRAEQAWAEGRLDEFLDACAMLGNA